MSITKTFILLILSCLISSFINAQSLELGLQVGNLQTGTSSSESTQEFDTYNIRYDYFIKGQDYSLSMFADFRKDTFKIFRVWAGYRRYVNRGTTIAEYSNGNHVNGQSDILRNSALIGFGYGGVVPFRFSKRDFQIKYGVLFPFQATYYDRENSIIDNQFNGIDTVLTEKTTVSPNQYRFGSVLFVNANYNFYKPLWIGLEMQSGLYYNYQNGIREETYLYTDPVTKDQIGQEVVMEHIDNRSLTTSLFTVFINLTYRF